MGNPRQEEAGGRIGRSLQIGIEFRETMQARCLGTLTPLQPLVSQQLEILSGRLFPAGSVVSIHPVTHAREPSAALDTHRPPASASSFRFIPFSPWASPCSHLSVHPLCTHQH